MTWCVGIDEAGRGPVVGPLVVGICALPESDLPLLREQGVRDSKDLSPKKRAAIEAWFMQESEERGWFGEVVLLSAERIDLAMQGSGLNLLEVEGFQEALHLLPRRSNLQVMADACDVDADRFARRIVAGLNEWPWPESQVKAEHKADQGHLIVGMASILAKEARERAVAAIEARIGKPIGSGYPSDRVTKDALPFLCRPEGLDEDLRWGWATVERFWKANHAGEVPKRGQPRSVQQTLFEADRPRIS